MPKKCSLCEEELTIGTSVVWHFIQEHPVKIMDLLDDEYPKIFLDISRRLRLAYFLDDD
jgi:hypothetical protein